MGGGKIVEERGCRKGQRGGGKKGWGRGWDKGHGVRGAKYFGYFGDTECLL